MSKEEVIAVIKKAAEELGRAPSLHELQQSGKLSLHSVRKNFGHYVKALEASGLEATGHGYKVSPEALFLDWIRVVRQMKKVPSLIEFEAEGKYSTGPYQKRFGGWLQVAPALMRFALDQKLEAEWKDELEIVKAYLEDVPKETRIPSWKSRPALKPQLRLDEPIYGPPMGNAYLIMEPTNEQGVILIFGAVARKLGFAVIQIRTAYPDCEAYREVEPGRWQRVWIEFEEESRNFLKHGHDPAKCHLIVCWRHNWEECPLEVIELKSAIKGLAADLR